LKAEKDAVEAKLNRVLADLADATAANEQTIVNLKARNLQLEKQHRAMSQMVKQ
jgi:predicted  nucleic acid-binding Zn-ribbon protein